MAKTQSQTHGLVPFFHILCSYSQDVRCEAKAWVDQGQNCHDSVRTIEGRRHDCKVRRSGTSQRQSSATKARHHVIVESKALRNQILTCGGLPGFACACVGKTNCTRPLSAVWKKAALAVLMHSALYI